MADAKEQAAWLRRVLGVAIDGHESTASGVSLLPIWMAAKEDVDAGIAQLQRALRATDDPDLIQVAEFGLNGATDGQSVRLMAALRDAESAGPQRRAKLAKATAAFRAFLDGNRLVGLLEDNPFGVSVPVSKRLGAALDAIMEAA